MQTPADLIHFSRNMKSFIKGGENVTITGEGTEQFPLIISSTGGGGGGESLLKQAKVTVTPEQMLDLENNTVELIPAQGTNTVINVISTTMFLDFNSVSYDFGTPPELSINGITVSLLDINVLNGSVKITSKVVPIIDQEADLGFNNPLLLSTAVNPTQGDSPVTFIITYTVDDFN